MNKINLIVSELKKEIDILKKSKIPKIIFIGGIPGSGKSLLIEKALNDFLDDEFTIIEADLYRKYFKDVRTVEETVENSNKIELELLLYSLNSHKNIIHISSLRAFEYIDYLINNNVLKLGYHVYLYIIVTNQIVSSISTYERYIYDKKNNMSFPRINKKEYLELANEGFNQAIHFFENVNYFEKIVLFRRGENKSLPIKLESKNKICDVIEEELKMQISTLDYKKLKSKINFIENNLFEFYEKNEFDRVLKGIILKSKF